jgi:Ca2+-binding RTX toxin-like protein
MRPRRTSAARTITSAIATLLAVGACAPAAMAGAVTYDGAAIVFTGGDNLNHEVQFRYDASTGRDHVLDSQVITSTPGDCQYEVQYTWISCPGHTEMRVVLGSGNDGVTTTLDCFDAYTINLGEGTNNSRLSDDCAPGAPATIASGSGQDNLGGGAADTTFFAGGGDDNVNGWAGNDVIHGGDGADGVFGNGGNDQVYGEAGNDRLRGAFGNDLEDGGAGDDDIGYSPGVSHDDDQGADLLRGGDGADRLRLSGHSGGMTITLDGQANDGAPGEGDNIGSDIEKISGTPANDVFTGSPGRDDFEGDSGNDEIHGAGGDDELYGGGGDDRLFGDAGNDKVQGANGSDSVDGGPGLDQIYGDIGSCSFSCSFDADTLFARDGERDAVDCGGGADTAQVDGLEVVAFCASVDRQNLPAAIGAPGAGAGAGSAAAALGLRVARSITSRVLLRRGLALRLDCAGACKIVATLRYKRKQLGAARRTLLSAGPAKLVVKVSRKARGTIRRLRRGTLTLRLKVTDAAAKTTTVTRTVALRR